MVVPMPALKELIRASNYLLLIKKNSPAEWLASSKKLTKVHLKIIKTWQLHSDCVFVKIRITEPIFFDNIAISTMKQPDFRRLDPKPFSKFGLFILRAQRVRVNEISCICFSEFSNLMRPGTKPWQIMIDYQK